MKLAQMLEKLAERYGKQNVLVHSEYHTQVVCAGKKHDIWFSTKEGLKWRMAGMQHTGYGSPERLLSAFDKYDAGKTDLTKLTAAVELCAAIDKATAFFTREKITQAIFCDAGFKNGAARISVVLVDGDRVDAMRRAVTAKHISEAEELAIEEALTLADRQDVPFDIYSDSLNAVTAIGLARVKWISRDQNKVADKLANLRGAQMAIGAGGGREE